MTTVKPIGERVLVKRLESESVSAGGIIIPDSAKEKPFKGKVVAVSDAVKAIKEEDVVLFAKWGGTEIDVDGDEHLIMKEEDVLAIVK